MNLPFYPWLKNNYKKNCHEFLILLTLEALRGVTAHMSPPTVDTSNSS